MVKPRVLLIEHGLLAGKLLVHARYRWKRSPHSLFLILPLFENPLDVLEGLRVRTELHNDLFTVPRSELKGPFLSRGAVFSIVKHEIHVLLVRQAPRLRAAVNL